MGACSSLWSSLSLFFNHLLHLLDSYSFIQFSSVQFSRSVVSDSLRPHESQHTRPPCPSPTPGVHPDSSIESVMPSSHLILCRPLLLLPPIPPSIRVFSNESTLRMRWPKYWSFSFSIIPSKEKKSQGWSPSEWTGWISLQSKGLSALVKSPLLVDASLPSSNGPVTSSKNFQTPSNFP